MTPKIDWIAIIILLGALQGILLAFVLIKAGKKRISNYFLGVFFGGISCFLIEIFLNHSHYMLQVPHLSNFSEPLNFAVAPLLYLSIFTLDKTKVQRTYLLHFIPLVIYTLLMIQYYALSADYKTYVYLRDYSAISYNSYYDQFDLVFRRYVNQITFLAYLFYLSWSAIILIKTKRANTFSVSQSAFTWLVTLFVFLVTIFLVYAGIVVVLSHQDQEYYFGLLFSAFVYYNSYKLLSQPQLISERLVPEEPKKNSLTMADDQVNSLKVKLLQLFEQDKPFLQSDFSLQILANKLQVPSHHISHILNVELNTGFFDLVNQHRISEAKLLLKNPAYEHLKIEEIGYEVGYNSKSTFYTAFKKLTGETPSNFKKNTSQSRSS